MLDADLVRLLEGATRVGKEVWLKARDQWTPVLWGVVEEEVSILGDQAKHVIQRIRLADGVAWDASDYGYKVGSFVYDDRAGAVRWANHSQLLSEKEVRELLSKARSRGWDIV
jgi:hypothetical protein